MEDKVQPFTVETMVSLHPVPTEVARRAVARRAAARLVVAQPGIAPPGIARRETAPTGSAQLVAR